MKQLIFAAAAVVAAGMTACADIPTAAAQSYGAGPNYSLRPAYGTINLNAGFTPDPYVVSLDAGGSISAQSSVSSSCRGWIAQAPDVRLNYRAGDFPLYLSVSAATDTTLVVNGPDGSWYCDDDGGVNGLNPALRFGSPPSGQYDIWIGTYSSGALQPARLHISELESQ